jgi:aminopeptidase N
MWFGDSVSPERWSDLWLNEGHASWYEFLYAEQRGELADDTQDYPDPTRCATFDEPMKAVYAHGDQWRHDSGPVAAPSSADTLFDLQRYHGGALVFYALRQLVGATTFQRIERAWVQRYEGQSPRRGRVEGWSLPPSRSERQSGRGRNQGFTSKRSCRDAGHTGE